MSRRPRGLRCEERIDTFVRRDLLWPTARAGTRCGHRLLLDMRFGSLDLDEADVAYARVARRRRSDSLRSSFLSGYAFGLAAAARYEDAMTCVGGAQLRLCSAIVWPLRSRTLCVALRWLIRAGASGSRPRRRRARRWHSLARVAIVMSSSISSAVLLRSPCTAGPFWPGTRSFASRSHVGAQGITRRARLLARVCPGLRRANG